MRPAPAAPTPDLRQAAPEAPQRRAMAFAQPPMLGPLLREGTLDADGQRLLQQVDQLTLGRWQRQAPSTGEDRTAAPLRQWLLPPGTAPRARLRLDRDGLRWTEPDGSTWFAPLDASAVQELQDLR
jgi:hypothetical protein